MDRTASRMLVRNTQLRRLMAAWTAFYVGDLAHFALIIVFAFSVGGVPAVGAVTVLNVLPGGLVGPLTTSLATSPKGHVHLAIGIGGRALGLTGIIVAILVGAPFWVVLALVAVDSLISSAVRPLHGALVVRLADNVAEAAAANAATSSLVNLSALVGPALAAVALNVVGIGWAFALPAVTAVLGMIAALLITVPMGDAPPEISRATSSRSYARAHATALSTGFRSIMRNRGAAAATALFFLNMTLMGVWDVASAPLAHDSLGLGEDGVATLMTLFGVGGLLGALATLTIVGWRGLSYLLVGAMAGLALAIAALGAVTSPVLGLILAAAVGCSAAVVYAVAPTLVQRSVVSHAMVPAAASLQSLYLVGLASGAVIAPLLVEWVGVTAALAIMGGATIVITALAWPSVRRADAISSDDAAALTVIRSTPLLAPLPGIAIEQLARAATRLTVPAGESVIRQGDSGDRFYMIATGLADVTVDDRLVATLGPGGSFGEIALLHDGLRSASVTAREDLDLVVVDRTEFLGALSSETGAVGRLGGVARARLGTKPVEERLAELDHNVALGRRSVAALLGTQAPLSGISADGLTALADSARLLAAPDGALLTREGDYGDCYYVIVEGAAQVLEGDTPRRILRPGDGFGERAILRDVPRTATVRAMGHTTVVAVDREAFQRARRGR